MNKNTVIRSICFSPTKTTEKIVSSISRGTNIKNTKKSNITFSKFTAEIASDELVIIGAPVYAGRLPPLFLERIKNLKGNNNPAIIVVVYGNRDYNDALIELYDAMRAKNFNIIAAAAFIGEHSFSTSEYPIAKERPDKQDLEKALNFGKSVIKRIHSGYSDDVILKIPGNKPYKELKPMGPMSPVTNDNCIKCMSCVEACPTGAVSKADVMITDSTKCIKCAACIKVCKQHARKFINQNILDITVRLYNNCQTRREPEIFAWQEKP